jgi:alpha-D-xyloside xylohydrolase
MLGDSLLVAPIFRPDNTVDYYLPKGTWTNFITNKRVEGGSWQYETHDFMSLPLMARPNSIIAVGSNNSVPDYDYLDGTELHVFELTGEASATVCSVDGKPKGMVLAERKANRISIKVAGLKNYSIIMRNVSTISDLSGASFESHELGAKLIPAIKTDEIVFEIIE